MPGMRYFQYELFFVSFRLSFVCGRTLDKVVLYKVMYSQSKINLIYIASIGRSGSTLLELLLGAHPEAMTVGEIQELPWEFKHSKGIPCACGLQVPECSFWKDVVDKVRLNELKGTPINFFREKYLGSKVIRWGIVKKLLLDNWDDDELKGQISEYGYNNNLLFRAILSIMDRHLDKRPQWIIDSSKCLYRLLWLQLSGYFNIKVIHLIKDPRGYVYSRTKRLLKHEGVNIHGPEFMNRVLRTSGKWLIENYLIDLVCRNKFNTYQVMKLRYEDLAVNPEKSLRHICDFLGWDYTERMIGDFRIQKCHTIAGNGMRFGSAGIHLDEKWRYQLPKMYALLSHVITYPMQKQLGY